MEIGSWIGIVGGALTALKFGFDWFNNRIARSVTSAERIAIMAKEIERLTKELEKQDGRDNTQATQIAVLQSEVKTAQKGIDEIRGTIGSMQKMRAQWGPLGGGKG